MMESNLPKLSSNNHFKFGYDGAAFTERKDKNCTWWVEYGRALTRPFTFKEACIENAKAIRHQTTKPIWVLFSGGIDSEVTLRSFVEAKIEVSAAILRFNDELNLHDISYAIYACEELKIPYKIFDLDIKTFWKTEAINYADETQCFSPQLISTMYLMDQVEGYCVLGGGECLLTKQNNEWFLVEKERIASWYRYFIKRGKEGCAGFFQFTPEIMLAYLEDRFVVDCIVNKSEKYQDSSEFKYHFYKNHFDIAARPKYTGFEKLQNEDSILREKLKEKYSHYDQISKTEVNELISKIRPLRNHQV